MMDAEVATVLEAAPGFVDRYLDLVDAADGDPGTAATFTELADYVAGLLGNIDHVTPVLTRCLEAVESVAANSEEVGRDRGVGLPRQSLPRRSAPADGLARTPHSRLCCERSMPNPARVPRAEVRGPGLGHGPESGEKSGRKRTWTRPVGADHHVHGAGIGHDASPTARRTGA